jgi:hypothetical protein
MLVTVNCIPSKPLKVHTLLQAKDELQQRTEPCHIATSTLRSRPHVLQQAINNTSSP